MDVMQDSVTIEVHRTRELPVAEERRLEAVIDEAILELCRLLQRRLVEQGFTSVRVLPAGEDPK